MVYGLLSDVHKGGGVKEIVRLNPRVKLGGLSLLHFTGKHPTCHMWELRQARSLVCRTVTLLLAVVMISKLGVVSL